MKKFIDNLFNKKENQMIEACQDIHVLIEDSKDSISNTQCLIADIQEGIKAMQDNVKEYLRLSDQNIALYDEMKAILDEMVGDK